MTWVRIESGFLRHRKVIDLPIAAKMLFIGGLCYSAENGTDGHISKAALRVLAAELGYRSVTTPLEEAGLWHKVEDGWMVHDYLTYQPSAAQERARRQEHANRVKRWRDQRKRTVDLEDRGSLETKRDTECDTVTRPARDTSCDGVRDAERALSPNPNPNPSSTTSSSSEPVVADTSDEEEDSAIAEAKRRLSKRAGAPLVDPEAWVDHVADQLRREGWKPSQAAAKTRRPREHPPGTPAKRPDCPTCDGLSLIGDGFADGYQPCPDCNGAGAVHSTPTARTGDTA